MVSSLHCFTICLYKPPTIVYVWRYLVPIYRVRLVFLILMQYLLSIFWFTVKEKVHFVIKSGALGAFRMFIFSKVLFNFLYTKISSSIKLNLTWWGVLYNKVVWACVPLANANDMFQSWRMQNRVAFLSLIYFFTFWFPQGQLISYV